MSARVRAPQWSMLAVLLLAPVVAAEGPCWIFPPRCAHLNDPSTYGYVPTRWRIWTPPVCIDEEAPMTKVPEVGRAETEPKPEGRRATPVQEASAHARQPVGRPATLIGTISPTRPETVAPAQNLESRQGGDK